MFIVHAEMYFKIADLQVHVLYKLVVGRIERWHASSKHQGLRWVIYGLRQLSQAQTPSIPLQLSAWHTLGGRQLAHRALTRV